MNIGIDYSPASATNAGIGYMTIELTKALVEHYPENNYFIYTDKQELADRQHFVYIERPFGPAAGTRWAMQVARRAKEAKLDYLLSPTNLWWPLWFRSTAQLVNDLSPIVFPAGFSLRHRIIYRIGLAITNLFAKRLIFISKAVEQEFRERYGSEAKKGAITLGLSEFTELNLDQTKQNKLAAKLKLPKHYFCSVSTLEPRKNYENALKAFAKFHAQHPDYHYLIAGKKGWRYQHLAKLVEQLNLKDSIRFLGFVDEAEKYTLIKKTSGFLYLSHYEGFGLPNIEAATLGAPILTSDIPVLRETMEDYALFADPKNTDMIASQMERLLSMQHRNFDSSKYTWKDSAAQLLAILE